MAPPPFASALIDNACEAALAASDSTLKASKRLLALLEQPVPSPLPVQAQLFLCEDHPLIRRAPPS